MADLPRNIGAARVVAGGLLGGVVLIAINVGAQVILGARAARDADAWLPGAADQLAVGSTAAAVGLLAKLAIGVLLVWLYAWARLVWGAGPRTVALVALVAWTFGAIFFLDFPLIGIMSWTTYAITELVQLVAFVAATWAGTRCYAALTARLPGPRLAHG